MICGDSNFFWDEGPDVWSLLSSAEKAIQNWIDNNTPTP